ncbi:MAG TPA: class I SAM-dependent methyltransferase [Pyrinomonadaceae bacterium]|nr:class I SAM-dependent methyltransferase [Pyrinomonadaceae bacterium]
MKRALKTKLASFRIWRATRAIAKLRGGEVPDRRTLRLLSEGWGNDGFAPTLDYLEEVARSAATTEGPILECGSGLTTLLMGLLAGRRGVAIHSLEHSESWQQRISNALRKNGIRNVEVLMAPLRDYGSFAWYDAPLHQLPEEFRLIVCDGPPGNTKGGRYGLLPVIGPRLRQGAVIVLDDADRPGEIEMVSRWKKEMDLAMQVFEKPAGHFARLVRCS